MRRPKKRSGSTLLGQGSTWQWRKLRAMILVRDGWRCVYCGVQLTIAKGMANSATVDHRIPRSMGGTDHPENLVACCAVCQYAPALRSQPDHSFFNGQQHPERPVGLISLSAVHSRFTANSKPVVTGVRPIRGVLSKK